MKLMYDIGIIYRSNHNYGANLTHLSLCQFLKDISKTILMIDVPIESKLYLPADDPDPMSLFEENPYKNVDFYRARYYWDLVKIGGICNIYIVSSDQLWRSYFLKATNYYSLLDWTDDDRFRMSYATSFGVECFEGTVEDTHELSVRLSRFNSISVRESSGIGIVESICKNKAEWVADPVFLLDRYQYIDMFALHDNNGSNGVFIGAYFLDMTDDKIEFIKNIIKYLRINRCETILDAMQNHEFNDIQGDDFAINFIKPKVEGWLTMIKNCEFLVTDSFHGTCFAIIFRKPFYVVFSESNSRGYARIREMLGRLGLTDRIISDEVILSYGIKECMKIDYDSVEVKLSEFIKHSKKWLNRCLKKAEEINMSALSSRNCFQLKLLDEKIVYKDRLKSIKENCTIINFEKPVVLWGAGNCFRDNIKWLVDIMRIEYVVDINPNKWSKNYIFGLICDSWENIKQNYMNQEMQVLILILDEKSVCEIKEFLAGEGDFSCASYRELVENTLLVE
ncbi:MAG: polysaccharide pyruvyl transferase family protein [Lachnospiraceae bacterium]|nr:polysaccharide pyruvyl transferase family protein [Lachnospiraceae bacterium]